MENVCGEMVLIIIAWKRLNYWWMWILGVNTEDIREMSILVHYEDINDNESLSIIIYHCDKITHLDRSMESNNEVKNKLFAKLSRLGLLRVQLLRI